MRKGHRVSIEIYRMFTAQHPSVDVSPCITYFMIYEASASVDRSYDSVMPVVERVLRELKYEKS